MNRTRTLGLIGGLGLEAGIYYYQQLVKAHKKLGSPLRMVLVHADIEKAMGHMFAGERTQLAAYLNDLIGQLAAGGADIAVVPAVTPHACIDQVIARSPLPIVNMLEALANDLQVRGMKRVALFGTKFVIESDLYGALPASIEVVRPKPEELKRIDEMYRAYAVQGKGGAAEREEFTKIADELRTRENLDAIVLAGTDLSALFEEHEPVFPYVDASQVHIARVIQQLAN